MLWILIHTVDYLMKGTSDDIVLNPPSDIRGIHPCSIIQPARKIIFFSVVIILIVALYNI